MRTAKKDIFNQYSVEIRESSYINRLGRDSDIRQLHYKNLVYIHVVNFWCYINSDNRLINREYESKAHYYLAVSFVKKNGNVINYRREISRKEFDHLSRCGANYNLITETFD